MLAVADFSAFGIVPTRKRHAYSILEPLGGVQKVVDLNYLHERRVLPLHFNVSNSSDQPRTIYLVPHLTLPPGAETIGVQVDAFAPNF